MRVQINPSKDKPGFFTVIPYGPIDSDSHGEFRDKIKSLLVVATRGVVLDLANVDYISSAGLGVLFTMKKTLVDNKGELLFCNLKPQIVRLFEIVNALPKETLFKNLEEADAYFYKMMNKKIEEDE